jgi:hypothetical protein
VTDPAFDLPGVCHIVQERTVFDIECTNSYIQSAKTLVYFSAAGQRSSSYFVVGEEFLNKANEINPLAPEFYI